MSDADAAETTVSCPDCDWVFTGPAKGKGNAAMRLGGHRYSKHGYKSPAPKKKTSRPAAGPTTPVSLAIVRDAVDEISERSTKPPTIDELTRAGQRLIGTATVALASWAAETDPTVTSEADKEALVDYLSADPDAAKDMAYPFARALGRSKLNAKMGRTIVDNVDLASASAEIMTLTWRWRRYFRERDRRIAAMGLGSAPAPVAATAPQPGPAMPASMTAPAGPPMTAPPMRGVVAQGPPASANGQSVAAVPHE